MQGHRPPGTEEAAARMVVETQERRLLAEKNNVAKLQELQCQLAQLHNLWHDADDMEQDGGSDDESVAPSEAGELVEVKGKKRLDKEIRKAKQRKLNEFRKVMSKTKPNYESGSDGAWGAADAHTKDLEASGTAS